MEPISYRGTVAQVENKQPNDKAKSRQLYYIAKLAETILVRPVVTTAKLACRIVKLITWVPAKSGLYKISGDHVESAAYFEQEWLKTGKALRDFLFLPSVAKRTFKNMIARKENFVDDVPPKRPEEYLNVPVTKKFQQYTSYQHGCETFEITCPQGIGETAARSDASLKTVMASHFLKPDMLAINFGCPNVAAFMTKKESNGSIQTLQVDAKSLRRAKMTYHETNGKIQSGVFFVPTNLPKEALERFNTAATNLTGRADITCVNTNCRVLEAAGFSIEGVNMQNVVFPIAFMEHLLFRNVFYKDSNGVKHKVHFDIINTTPHNLEEYAEVVDTAVIGTRLRHRRRDADTEENMEARGAAAKALIAQEKKRLAENPPALQVNDNDLGKRKITVSVPSFLGDAVARIWGRHTLYEVDLADKREEIAKAFKTQSEQSNEELKLKPFPHKKPSWATRLKRDFLFSGPVIRLLRGHMMGRADTLQLNTRDLFDHLKSTAGERLNYVVLDDKVVLAKTQANGQNDQVLRKGADWALSKHAILAGRQDVYCSGEIWYNKDKKCFEINHDSGTYMPNKQRVEVVAKLANEIFNAQRFGNVFQVADAVA